MKLLLKIKVLVMSIEKTIEVLFELPRTIEAGLNSGKYKRVGGVIQNVSSGKIVCWLREGIDSPESLKGTTPAAMATIGTALTALNLAVNVTGFIIVIKKLNEIKKELINIEKRLEEIEGNINT